MSDTPFGHEGDVRLQVALLAEWATGYDALRSLASPVAEPKNRARQRWKFEAAVLATPPVQTAGAVG